MLPKQLQLVFSFWDNPFFASSSISKPSELFVSISFFLPTNSFLQLSAQKVHEVFTSYKHVVGFSAFPLIGHIAGHSANQNATFRPHHDFRDDHHPHHPHRYHDDHHGNCRKTNVHCCLMLPLLPRPLLASIMEQGVLHPTTAPPPWYNENSNAIHCTENIAPYCTTNLIHSNAMKTLM